MNKLTRIVLAVSLVFNGMFAIGYFSARSSADTAGAADRAADLVAEKLGLDESQRDRFVALRQEAGEQAKELHEATALAQEALWVESCSPEGDPEKVRALKADLFELRRAHREINFQQFSRFLEVLTPEQRQRVQEKLRRHGPPRRFRGRLLRRFDEDGDGTLSQEEREKAMRGMRERFRGFRGGPPTRLHDEGHGPRPMRPGGRHRGRGPMFRGGPHGRPDRDPKEVKETEK